jgi:nicotinamide-nucleotide amidase
MRVVNNFFYPSARPDKLNKPNELYELKELLMIAEILSTGEEVLNGVIVDSNAAHIAQRLFGMGLRVSRHTTVGDRLSSLADILKEIGNRADVALVTGGLGPTTDDLSAEAAARAMGVPLKLDQEALDHIAEFFKMRGVEMKKTNEKQAFFPQGAQRLDNPVGTAPGFSVTIGKCRFFFMPGVPFEMHRMMQDWVLPGIAGMLGDAGGGCNILQVLSTFGLAESTVGHLLAGFESACGEVQLGYQVAFPGIFVKLYGHGQDEAACRGKVDDATDWVCQRLGNHVVSREGQPMEAVLGRLLSERKETLAVAESCTGGLISHWLTNVAGSSDYFLFSGVTYSNEAKQRVLGVSKETLKRFGAVHERTAGEMAAGARHAAGATYGLATSGIAGPGGGSPDKPVGTVCIGLAGPDGTQTYRFHFTYGQRLMMKKMFAMKALDLLRRHLVGTASVQPD